VTGSLLTALALTALADPDAQADPGDPRDHARLAQHVDLTELRVLDWALWNVSKYYVEPERIDPGAMTLAGLESLEQSIPEVLVETLDDGSRVRVRVGTESKEFDANVKALWAVGPHLREVFRFIDAHASLTEEEARSAEYAIVEGVLSTLDPHTNLLRPDDFEDMKTSTKGSFGGLGIEVGMRDGKITVIRVLDGNPAAKSGLKAGDRIVQIEEESAVSMTINEAVSRLRGAPGTTVTLHVRREGEVKPLSFDITRDVIRLESATGEILPGLDHNGKPAKVGLIQIPRNFSQNTAKEMRKKLDEFEKAGVKGVVLDMRDNPGGLLNAAVDVANAFLSAGTIVSTVGSSSPRDESRADGRYDFPDVPVVVLVDQGSASATEIVAGALRNNDRAVILGRRTFGKGSVQVLHDRRVGDKELALKLTIAQYLTPGDVSIQSVGVSPDVETIPVWIGEEYVRYFSREWIDLVREESLAAHLESGKAKRQEITAGPLYFLQRGSVGESDLEQESVSVDETDKARVEELLRDSEVRMARDLVLWAPSAKRSEILARIDEFVDDQEKIEGERLTKSLAKRGVDWTPGPKPQAGQQAKLRVNVAMDRKNNVIPGGEAGTLTLSVTNIGDAAAYQVRAMSDSDYSFFNERELMFGKIAPGETRTSKLKLSVSEHELSRTDRIDFLLHSQHEQTLVEGDLPSIDISAAGLARPLFAYGYRIIDDPKVDKTIKGNGDGALQVGERVLLRVDVQNNGEGPALDSWVNLRNFAGENLYVHTARGKLGKLKPGENATAELDVEVKGDPGPTGAEVSLTVSDNKIGEVLSEKLVFPVVSETVKIESRADAVKVQNGADIFASAVGEPRVIAHAEPGTTFNAAGVGGGFVRIDLGDGHGFVDASQTQPAKKVRRPGKYQRVLEVSPPKIEIVGQVTQTDGESIYISGSAIDPHGVRDMYITVANPSRDIFAGREKVFYQANAKASDQKLDFAADIPLTPGNNLIEIHARQDDDVVATHRMWVLRTSGLAEARKKERSLEAAGKLSVDTFKK